MIHFQDVHLRLGGRPVLRGFELNAPRGELSLVVGSNGAGKSSAFKVAAGLWRPSSGRVRTSGTRAGKRRGVAYLPQSSEFHPRLRCEQVLRFYARLEGKGRAEVAAALELFGLEERAKSRVGELSGGLRQRLGLATLSFASAPAWVLDEPGLSLDPYWRRFLQQWLRAACDDGHTVLVATHLLAEWEAQTDHSYLCEDGRIVGALNPNQLRGALLGVQQTDEIVPESLPSNEINGGKG